MPNAAQPEINEVLNVVLDYEQAEGGVRIRVRGVFSNDVPESDYPPRSEKAEYRNVVKVFKNADMNIGAFYIEAGIHV